MKISTRGRYALRILLDLARHNGDEPRMVSDICKRQNLSPKYAGRLILELRNAGMVISTRGAKGGYKINRDPKHITLLEILDIMEGGISVVDCALCPKKCKRSKNCSARNFWVDLNSKIRSTLANATLQDILDKDSNHCIR